MAAQAGLCLAWSETPEDVLSCRGSNAREAPRPGLSSPSEMITMLNKTEKKKHDYKEQGKTQHEAPLIKKHKSTQNKNLIRATVLERSVASTIEGLILPFVETETQHN